ncbi:MAG: DegV family protein [Acutalibacteraceae bacterium]
MSNYVLITDSTNDLPADAVQEADIIVMPMTFTIGEMSYKNYSDHRELSPKDFYQMMRDGAVPTTVQLTPSNLCDFFEPYLQKGLDIIYLAFSSALSGTYASGLLAADEMMKKYPDRRIAVIDSRCASLGEGLFAYLAGCRRKKGASFDELQKWILENRLTICHWFTVDHLKYLKRGGRISSATAMVGTALQIKPLIYVDDEGRLIPKEKIKGRKNSIEALLKKMETTGVNLQEQTVIIGHADAIEEAQYLKKEIAARFHPRKIIVGYIGPVIGAHVGPGMVAVLYVGKRL